MEKDKKSESKVLSVLSLFTSAGTLLCCALPVTLSVIAGGAAVGSLLSAFPWLVSVSRHKVWIFGIAGLLLVFNGALLFRPQGKLACAVTGGKGCEAAGRFNKTMWWSAAAIYAVGFFFAYLLGPLLARYG
ncbi:MAG: hypothetical protein KGL04_06475 [Elusimicrobia bacterium]|nr:hypothetical protein [Elusimicrobiota bacterium]MDE2313800.1 hypothetical protein [Elusimicrobiota bacterium]